jgi:hypothetical protein
MTVEAEDALIAALKVKTAHPEAAITYVRKRNARGDRRHPHSNQIDEDPAGQAAGEAAGSHDGRQASSLASFSAAVSSPLAAAHSSSRIPGACARSNAASAGIRARIDAAPVGRPIAPSNLATCRSCSSVVIALPMLRRAAAIPGMPRGGQVRRLIRH